MWTLEPGCMCKVKNEDHQITVFRLLYRRFSAGQIVQQWLLWGWVSLFFGEKFSLTAPNCCVCNCALIHVFSLITFSREDHPSYRSDTPHPITLRLIPFGLPRGATSMRGIPFGLLAYAAKYGSWKAMLKQYQRHRMQERVFQTNYGRAYNSWSAV